MSGTPEDRASVWSAETCLRCPSGVWESAAKPPHSIRWRAIPMLRSCAWALVFMWLCAGTTAYADQGTLESDAFTVDTRWGFNDGNGVSGRFILDTRFSGSAADGSSDLFTLDTQGAVVASAAITGRVTDTGNTSLPDTAVNALQNGIVKASVACDGTGNYQLPLLPPGTYEVRAVRLNYLTGLRQGLVVGANQTVQQNFALKPRPALPVSQVVTRTPESTQLPTPSPQPTSPQLKLWTGTGFGSLPSDTTSLRTKMTIVLTHGWNSSPIAWAQSMANGFVVSPGPNTPNIVAWDWEDQARTPFTPTGLINAMSKTGEQGEQLGAALAQAFPGYQHPIHFIGHSLGTLVNATAANYLHEMATPAFDWRRTHVTLLDDAELVNVAGVIVTYGYNVSGLDGSIDNRVVNQGWVSPTPRYAAWIDNYISFVGDYHAGAVNVNLKRAPFYHGANVVALHGYAYDWYGKTVLTPDACILGNRISFERLGEAADLPTRSPWTKGTILFQDPSPFKPELDLIEPLTPAELASLLAQKARTAAVQAYHSTVDATVGAMQTVGGAVVHLTEKMLNAVGVGDGPVVYLSTPDYTTPAYFSSNPLQPTLTPAWSYGFDLNTLPAISFNPQSAQSGIRTSNVRLTSEPSPGPTNTPAYVWMTVAVPPNTASLSFDFIYRGNGSNDSLAAGINGTNVFSLATRFMPVDVPLNSGALDVAQYAGQSVEMFFGVVGGTSTNASLTVDGIRFYQLVPPTLQVTKAGNQATVAWPISAPGFVLESTSSLAGTNQWESVTNAPDVADFEFAVTNAIFGEARFFRLRKP